MMIFLLLLIMMINMTMMMMIIIVIIITGYIENFKNRYYHRHHDYGLSLHMKFYNRLPNVRNAIPMNYCQTSNVRHTLVGNKMFIIEM